MHPQLSTAKASHSTVQDLSCTPVLKPTGQHCGSTITKTPLMPLHPEIIPEKKSYKYGNTQRNSEIIPNNAISLNSLLLLNHETLINEI